MKHLWPIAIAGLVWTALACNRGEPRRRDDGTAAAPGANAPGAAPGAGDPSSVTGIGIRPVSHPQGFAIGQVFPGGPADEAGLRAGDVVIEVDGESTARWSLDRTAKRLRGEAGTQVRMAIERDGKRVDVVVERRQVAVPPPPSQPPSPSPPPPPP